MSSTTAALRALASHVLPRMEDSPQGIGVHLDTRWTGEGPLHLGTSEVSLIWCESPLAAREAMVAQEQFSKPWFLLTPLHERELGDDVLARLFRCRLLRLDRWQILRDRLGAHRIDPRLSRFSWLAEAMLEVLPQSGSKVPSGFLDAATAWGILLEGYFGLHEPRPDLRALLAWSRSAEASAWIERVGPELLEAASAWVRESAGEAGARILALAHDGHARDAMPLGIIMDLVFGDNSDDPDLRIAAARLERFVGNRPIPVVVGRRWGQEAASSLRREIRSGGAEAEGPLLRAEAIAREIDLGEASGQSRLLPSGLTYRWKSLASALQGGEALPLKRALDELLGHELVRDEEAETAQLLVRLKSWLLGGDSEVPASMPGFGKWYSEDGCWVDRLRNGLRARSLPATVEPAAKALLDEADQKREDLNRAFGKQLAGWLSTGARATGTTLESERFVPEILAPLAASGPVLFVLLDGLSSAVLLDLLPHIRDQGWRELAPAETPTRRLLVAPLPTVTEVTRCSLLAGRLLQGKQNVEAKAFSRHPKLVAASTTGRPPRLFHKGDLENDAGMLSSELREVLLERDQRVVGVVVNAIDDQLSGSDQISLRWTESIIWPLQSLLTVAGQAGRLVVVAGDHGHVLENDSNFRKHSGGARWRPVTGEQADDEVLLEGPRVLIDSRILAPWSEKVRYGSKRAGYHGGASPQEVLVPFAVFSTGEPPSGWLEIEPEPPLWWTGEEAMAPVAAPVAAAPPEVGPEDNQLGLFSPPAEPVADQAPWWIGQLMASEVLAQQRPLAGRAGLDEELMQKLLIALERRGGRATRPALAQSMGYPAGRLRGFLALVQKLLNVEGFPVLEVDEASATVVFNRELLLTQFELDR